MVKVSLFQTSKLEEHLFIVHNCLLIILAPALHILFLEKIFLCSNHMPFMLALELKMI